MSEHDEQAAFVEWLAMTHPDVLFFSIPNGAHLAGGVRQRSATMNILKREGLLPGAADLFIAEPRGKWKGLFIEMKKQGGRLNENQEWFLSQVAARGYLDAVCYGFDEARAITDSYLKT